MLFVSISQIKIHLAALFPPTSKENARFKTTQSYFSPTATTNAAVSSLALTRMLKPHEDFFEPLGNVFDELIFL